MLDLWALVGGKDEALQDLRLAGSSLSLCDLGIWGTGVWSGFIHSQPKAEKSKVYTLMNVVDRCSG